MVYASSMSAPALGPLEILATGLGHLRRHPFLTLGIVALGALLSALATLLQIRLHLPDDLTTMAALGLTAMVGFATMVPLLLYVVPRFLAYLDAEHLDHPKNALVHWKDHFEARWLKTFGARMLLYLVASLGATMCFFPGIFVLAVFGWTPLRVLLRGDALVPAARSSLALMAKTWPLVLRTVLAILGAYLLFIVCVVSGIALLIPEPTPWQRLTHPAMWGGRLVMGLLDLALSVCLLALYHAIEPALEAPPKVD